LPDYHIPEYHTWLNRLRGLIGVSVVGAEYIRGQEGWRTSRARLEAENPELPDQLQAWLEKLRKQLSKEWYKELKHTEAIMWDQWLKDFQERVQAVSKRCGFVTAGELIVSRYFVLSFQQDSAS
jgi:hypothetical protein